MMQTECPHCHTLFRVTEEQLEQSNGEVRCGHCLAVFSAQNPYRSPDAEQEPDNSEAEDRFEPPENLNDVVPPELRAETRSTASQRHWGATLFWTFTSLLLMLTLAGQWIYFDRNRLVQNNDLRPWLSLACQRLAPLLDCHLPDPRDVSRIELTSKNVFTHPNEKNALMISATLVNQAPFEQDYPIIELRFEDIRGHSAAARRFKPEEYLDMPASQIGKMEPGNPVTFKLAIQDPGKDVASYEFNFL